MNDVTEVHSDVPVTITLDLEQLLRTTQRWGDDGREDVYGEIIVAAASMVAERMYREATDYRDRLHDAIDTELEKVVAEALEKRFQPIDTYGSPNGEPTTLRDQIVKQAGEYMAKAMSQSDNYNRDKGALRKFIDTEIDKTIKAELLKSVQDAKALVVDKVKANAAQIISDTITKGVH